MGENTTFSYPLMEISKAYFAQQNIQNTVKKSHILKPAGNQSWKTYQTLACMNIFKTVLENIGTDKEICTFLSSVPDYNAHPEWPNIESISSSADITPKLNL